MGKVVVLYITQIMAGDGGMFPTFERCDILWFAGAFDKYRTTTNLTPTKSSSKTLKCGEEKWIKLFHGTMNSLGYTIRHLKSKIFGGLLSDLALQPL